METCGSLAPGAIYVHSSRHHFPVGQWRHMRKLLVPEVIFFCKKRVSSDRAFASEDTASFLLLLMKPHRVDQKSTDW